MWKVELARTEDTVAIFIRPPEPFRFSFEEHFRHLSSEEVSATWVLLLNIAKSLVGDNIEVKEDRAHFELKDAKELFLFLTAAEGMVLGKVMSIEEKEAD